MTDTADPRESITDDLALLLAVLPSRVREAIAALPERSGMLEIVLDLGRVPEVRFVGREVTLDTSVVTPEDIDDVLSRVGLIGGDNRAGIERTLHRISVIRNRAGTPVGLTCRVGRAVFGTITTIRDLVEAGQSTLLLGKPGVGKTTMLREVARVLADDLRKRVIVVDTSNEIAGDGDIPHPGIGRARRMQVSTPSAQHAVMIEAVENHMPEVIIIDEIGTELETAAARTIAERGVQLIGTAHGTTLDNLMMNPTLSDLIGGIQTVTLGDEEARRRGTQKSVLERKAPPTFQVVVEIIDWQHVTVHPNVAETVDTLLLGQTAAVEVRERLNDGSVKRTRMQAAAPRAERAERQLRRSQAETYAPRPRTVPGGPAGARASSAPDLTVVPGGARPPLLAPVKVYPFGISTSKLEQAARALQLPVHLVSDIGEARAVLTLRSYFRRFPETLREAEQRNVPVHVLRSNTQQQMQQVLVDLFHLTVDPETLALQEAEDAISRVRDGDEPIELQPAAANVRRQQHAMAERYNLVSKSWGHEPNRRVRIYRDARE
ncbi:MAG TPA: R3H domain-containing nucleic acid-binding protein [Chloroflexota bacterium]